MNLYVIKTDFNHPYVRRKIAAARSLQEINEFSTVKDISTIISNKMIDRLKVLLPEGNDNPQH